MKKLLLNSVRIYLIAYIEDDIATTDTISLERILMEQENEFEYIYALNENIDSILDLKAGERFQMNFNRDNSDSAGFIKRVR